MEEVNYPIVYAVLPMIEQVGWYDGLWEKEREYGPVAYIVSKCYLVGEKKEYKSDGSIELEYQVVCPYEFDDYIRDFKSQIPEYNLIRYYCTNCVKVENIYDNLEDAIKDKDAKNEDLLANRFSYMSYDKLIAIYDEAKKEHEEKISKYNEYENKIAELTSNLKVVSNKNKTNSEVLLESQKQYLEKLKRLAETDPEKAKEVCAEALIRSGIINDAGELKAPYNGEKVNPDDFTRGPKLTKKKKD